jgi:hypothetical protein
MSQSKREQVVSHLRYIRQELREMHQGVMEDGLLPEAGEVRGVMAQMEALLELLEGKGSRKAKAESLALLPNRSAKAFLKPIPSSSPT